MPIRYIKRYTRDDLRACPDSLFVFGDNMMRVGKGGQAAACRGEPNAVGIPTKWAPSWDEASYFTNESLRDPRVREAIDAAFARLEAHLNAGGTIFWPVDNVGTGLAELPKRAPVVNDYIWEKLEFLRGLGAGSELTREIIFQPPVPPSPANGAKNTLSFSSSLTIDEA